MVSGRSAVVKESKRGANGRWRLASYRRPFETKKLSKSDAKQLKAVLKMEGTTLKNARDGDEPITIEVVDVVDCKKPIYQLWLWSFGSGALFKAGSTKVAGTGAQHGFACEDAELAKALASAWKADAKKLKLEESIDSFDVQAKNPSKRGRLAIADIRTDIERGTPEYDEHGWALRGWYEELFGKRGKPYPKLRADELSTEQRLVLEKMLAADFYVSQYDGLFLRTEDFKRFLGKAKQGPSDELISVAKTKLPIWCAVSDVGSGHAKPDAVLAAFLKLPAAKALAAWTEMASRNAYDVLEPHGASTKEADIPKTKSKMEHGTRVYRWLADANVALGKPGRNAAIRILDELPEYYFSGQLLVAALSLVRHEKAGNGEFPAKFDKLLERLKPDVSGATEFADAVRDEIFAARGISAK